MVSCHRERETRYFPVDACVSSKASGDAQEEQPSRLQTRVAELSAKSPRPAAGTLEYITPTLVPLLVVSSDRLFRLRQKRQSRFSMACALYDTPGGLGFRPRTGDQKMGLFRRTQPEGYATIRPNLTPMGTLARRAAADARCALGTGTLLIGALGLANVCGEFSYRFWIVPKGSIQACS
ncbi:MAG: hypothetical protein ACI8XO_001251 [Verrucomicrobiales bacterium]|jgi:hypothetical protein